MRLSGGGVWQAVVRGARVPRAPLRSVAPVHTAPVLARRLGDRRAAPRPPAPQRRNRTYNDVFAQILLDSAMQQAPKDRRQQASWGSELPPPYAQPPYAQPRRVVLSDDMYGGQSGQGRGTGSLMQTHPRMMLLVLALGAGGSYYVLHLRQVPQTGRWRFIDVSTSEEQRMGQQAYAETMAQYRPYLLPDYDPASVQVRRVVSRILRVCDELNKDDGGPGVNETHWTVHVIDQPHVKNAFVLPGGKIFVFTGILPICRDDAGLATVLSHEVSHQLARHSAEKTSGVKIIMFLGVLLNMLGFDFGVSRIALNLLLSLPNSRKLETEADSLGLQIMARACYDPRLAVSFWQRMDRVDGGGGAGDKVTNSAKALLSTHPVNAQRIDNIQRWLPEVLRLYEERGCGAARGFRSALASEPERRTPSAPPPAWAGVQRPVPVF